MVKQSAKCALKCVQKYAHRFHSWEAVCPREHWGFGGARAPSQTTRPPHATTLGGVRVVWLGAFLVRKLAGADGNPGVRQARKRVCEDVGVGSMEGLGRSCLSQAGFHGGFESTTICPRVRRTL